MSVQQVLLAVASTPLPVWSTASGNTLSVQNDMPVVGTVTDALLIGGNNA